MSLVEHELPTLPEQLSSPPVFSGVRVTRSLVLYVCFVDRCLSFCVFLLAIVLSVLLSFGHCVVCSSVFWPLCCVFFFNIRILNNPLVSSNSSSGYLNLKAMDGAAGNTFSWPS